MRSDFEEKREARKERYQELAEKNRKESDARYGAAKKLGDMIPFGQPILVGHHSEGAHRAHIKRIDNNMRKSIEHGNKAEYYAQRAASMENDTTIYSDDPEALTKLKDRLERLENYRQFMKDANKAWRKYASKNDASELNALGFTGERLEKLIAEVDSHYSWNKRPFEDFRLTNLGANIRRIGDRIKQLERLESKPDEKFEYGDITIFHKASENRVQIKFPDKPSDEIRTMLKRYGFRWAKWERVWQRHYSLDAKHCAEVVVKKTINEQ